MRNRAPDPRAQQFAASENTLDSARATGDKELSQTILTGLKTVTVAEAKAEQFSVFTQRKDDAVLVLVKAPNLKNFKDKAREQLLQAITTILQLDDDLKDKRIYIGIKGKLSFGAIQVPPAKIETGSILSPSPLYEFYNNNPPQDSDKANPTVSDK
jgi:hypothetical protein